MAAPSGTEDPHVTSRYATIEKLLREEPWHFQFFQAVRLVQRVLEDREPVGRFVQPSKEVIRFTSNPSTAFPASQIQGLQWQPGAQPVMLVNFMGLTGPMGVLPLYYSELLLERLRAKDRTLLAFLDLFNHRMISLFYQAWEKYRFTIPYERGERDRFSHHLLDLIGLGTPGLARRQAVADDSLLFYAGLFAMHSRSAVALQQILADYFEVPVEVEQFMAAWHPLDVADQCAFTWGNSYSEQVGFGAVVGDEIWDQQSGIRLRLGPLTAQQYADFLPRGSAYEPLRAITKFFSGGELDFEVQLILKRAEVPPCELGDASPRLGWSTWVKSVPMTRDPSDTILRI